MNEYYRNQLIYDFASGLKDLPNRYLHQLIYFLTLKLPVFTEHLRIYLRELNRNDGIPVSKLKYTDCITSSSNNSESSDHYQSPISKLVGPLNNINWKTVYKGFSEFIVKIKDDDELN